MRLRGKVAFVTGAGSGIGRASARRFAAEGARVALAEISPSGRDVEREIRDAGGEALFCQTDVTDEAPSRARWQGCSPAGAASTCSSTAPAGRARTTGL